VYSSLDQHEYTKGNKIKCYSNVNSWDSILFKQLSHPYKWNSSSKRLIKYILNQNDFDGVVSLSDPSDDESNWSEDTRNLMMVIDNDIHYKNDIKNLEVENGKFKMIINEYKYENISNHDTSIRKEEENVYHDAITNSDLLNSISVEFNNSLNTLLPYKGPKFVENIEYVIKEHQNLTNEKQINIILLLEMNFITRGSYIVNDDKVILNEPFIFAHGDFITNRSGIYYDEIEGLMYRSCRINKRNI